MVTSLLPRIHVKLSVKIEGKVNTRLALSENKRVPGGQTPSVGANKGTAQQGSLALAWHWDCQTHPQHFHCLTTIHNAI